MDIFLGHFLLTDEEASILQSRDVQVDNRLFQAMSRAEQIIEDARVLMTGEDGSTKAGYVQQFRRFGFFLIIL